MKFDIELLLKDEKFKTALAKAFKEGERASKAIKDIEISNEAVANVNRVAEGLTKVSKASKKAKSEIESMGTDILQLGKAMNSLGNTLKKAFAISFSYNVVESLKAGLIEIVKSASKFQDEMLAIKQLLEPNSFGTKSLEKGFSDLTKEVKAFIKTTPQGAGEVTKALNDIIQSNIDVNDSMKVLEATNKLAIVGRTELSTATDGLTSILNAFNISAEDSTVVAAKMIKAQQYGKFTIEELSRGIGLAAATSASLGVSFDELASAAAAMTSGGIKTNAAFSAMAQLLQNMSKPTKEASETAKRLGINFDVGALKSKGFSAVLQELITKTAGSEQAMMDLVGSVEGAKAIFGLSGPKALEIYNNSLKSMADGTKLVTDLNKKHEESLGTLSRQWGMFYNKVTQGIEQSLLPALEKLGQGLKVVNSAMDLNTAIGSKMSQYEQELIRARKSTSDLMGSMTSPASREARDRLVELKEAMVEYGVGSDQALKAERAFMLVINSMKDPLIANAEAWKKLNDEKERYRRENDPLIANAKEWKRIQEEQQKQAADLAKRKVNAGQRFGDLNTGVSLDGLEDQMNIIREVNKKISEITAVFAKERVQVSAEALNKIAELNKKAADKIDKINKELSDKDRKLQADILAERKKFIAAGAKYNTDKLAEVYREEETFYRDIEDLVDRTVITEQEAADRKVIIAQDRAKRVKEIEDQMYIDSTNSLQTAVAKQAKVAESATTNIIRGILTLNLDLMSTGFDKLIDNWMGALDNLADSIANFAQGFDKAYRDTKDIKAINKELETLKGQDPKVSGEMGRIQSNNEKLLEARSKMEEDALRMLKEANEMRVEVNAYTTDAMIQAQREEKARKIAEAEEMLDKSKSYGEQEIAENERHLETLQQQQEDHNKKVEELQQRALDKEKERQDAIYESVAKAGQNAIGDFIGEWFGEGIGKLVTALIGPMFDKEMTDEQIQEASKVWVKAFIDMIKVVSQNADDFAIGLVQGILEAVRDAIADPSGWEDFIGGVWTIWYNALKGIWTNIGPSVTQFFSEFGAKIKQLFSFLFSNVWTELWGALKGMFAELGKNILNGINNLVAGIGDIGTRMWNAAVDGINKFTEQFKGWINSFGGLIPGGKGGGAGGGLTTVLTGGLNKIKLATGGQVVGAGNRDTVPAMLTPGELVVDRTTGPRLMDFIDNFDSKPQSGQDDGMMLAVLTDISRKLDAPTTVESSVTIDKEVFANIILQLNRNNRRLA